MASHTFASIGRKLYENGYSVIPIDGKRARLLNWSEYCRRMPTEDEISRWETEHGHWNVGLPAGPANGLMFLDCDAYTKEYADLVWELIGGSPFVRFGQKGFAVPIRFVEGAFRPILAEGREMVEMLGNGHQVVAFGTHPSGCAYRWPMESPLTVTRAEMIPQTKLIFDHDWERLSIDLMRFDGVFDERDLAKIDKRERGGSGVGGRNNALKAQVGAAVSKGKDIDVIAREIVHSDKLTHAEPLFESNEYAGADPIARAKTFIASISRSIVNDRLRTGAELPVPRPRVQLTPAEVSAAARPSTYDITHGEYPDETERGRRFHTIENLREMLNRLGVSIRFNQVSKRDEVVLPGLKPSAANETNVVLAHLGSWAERCRIGTKSLGQYLTAISDSNAYNPVRDWVESKPWDKVERVDNFIQTVRAKDESKRSDVLMMKARLMRLWLTSAVAALYRDDGVALHGILVFLGPQYMGKTQWFKRLLPDNLARYRMDGALLDTNNKDSVTTAISHWLVELGEVDATFKRSDSSHLKAFITKDRDLVRRPFAKADSHYPRQTAFFASVNEAKFLIDPTGNRRFWTIECESINWDHGFDMQQVWAEVAAEFHAGATHLLDKAELEMLNEHNESFTVVDPIEEMVVEHYAWGQKDVVMTNRTATQIAQDIGLKRITQSETRAIARIMRKVFGQVETRAPGGSARYYQVPKLKNIQKTVTSVPAVD